MGKQIVILGAGFGGLEAATSLREQLLDEHTITLIDRKDHFYIGFKKLEVMFGRSSADGVKSYYRDLAADGVSFVQDNIETIDTVGRKVHTTRDTFPFDILIVALGTDLAPDLTPGLVEGGHEFYSLEGAARLYPALESFTGGSVMLSVLGAPYKCPPAPYEAMFLLHDYFQRRGIRDSVVLKMLDPAPKPLPVAPNAAPEILARFEERDIQLYSGHKVTGLDVEAQAALIDGREAIPYDLFIAVPLHRPPQVVRDSDLGNGGWIRVDPGNLKTEFENVYAVGDVTTIPVGAGAVPKAGAFAEGGAKVVVSHIVHDLTGEGTPQVFDGVGACYLEFGEDQVAQISANFLGKAAPDVRLDAPTAERRIEKEQFEDIRLARWFKR